MAAQRERSLADVFQDIVANVQDIVRSELRLASVEIRQELVKAARAGKVAAAGGVLALFALAFLLLAAVYGLPWSCRHGWPRLRWPSYWRSWAQF